MKPESHALLAVGVAQREFFLAQGREYQAQAATATNPQ